MTRGTASPYPVYVDTTTGARMKHCPGCGQERSVDAGEFATRYNPHGTGVQYRHQCRACEAARGREYRARLGEEYREREAIRNRERWAAVCRRRRAERWRRSSSDVRT
jgi:hypothetical protein